MCWCDPNLRTPCCGKPDCHPPQNEPVGFKVPLTELMSMRQSCRDALSPKIVYKDGMSIEEMQESAAQARRQALVRIHDWLDNLVGDGM